MMERRCFLLTAVVGALAAPLRVHGQQAGRGLPQIGFLQQGEPSNEIVLRIREALRKGLLEHGGYVDGKNITMEYRTGVDAEALTGAAKELVHRKVDVVVAGGTPAGLAAQRAT